jgi:peptidoglycan hydrolase-like protein with peptidoglycan-binding domain
MIQKLALLAVGFLLTGVVGGALGYFFQRRAWQQQHKVERREEEHRQAVQTFEELASLLDKRLYRMRRWYWAIKRRLEGGGLDQVSAARNDYDEVLLVWNDNLNRILALVDTSFGHGVRRQLETGVFEEFAAVGRALEEFARQASGDRKSVEIPPLGRRLNMLSYQVYRLDSQMLSLMRDGHVGQSAPRAVASAAPSGLPQLQFGHNGPAVRRLQRALGRSGESPGLIDGGFGRNTDRALRAFQRSRGLDPDGIAGPRTWDALPSGTPMPVLREGAHGELVRELQAALAEYAAQRWETAPEQVDGIFNADTATAVEAFQRWHGLAVDGIVGDQTWAAGLDSAGNTLEGRMGLQHVCEGTST